MARAPIDEQSAAAEARAAEFEQRAIEASGLGWNGPRHLRWISSVEPGHPTRSNIKGPQFLDDLTAYEHAPRLLLDYENPHREAADQRRRARVLVVSQDGSIKATDILFGRGAEDMSTEEALKRVEELLLRYPELPPVEQ